MWVQWKSNQEYGTTSTRTELFSWWPSVRWLKLTTWNFAECLGCEGMSSLWQIQSRERKWMPRPCDFNVNGTTMFIYSNIVASSPVGNTFAPLLCTVHLEIDNKMETLHKNYTTIHYFPVRTSEFDTVEVQLCNVYGDNMVFYGGESAIVLHFWKVGEEM